MKALALALLPLAALAQDITAPPGFTVTKLRSAGGQEGSWVSLAVDDQGRFYVSPQEAIPYSGFAKDSGWGGLFRATLDAQGQLAAWDRVPCPIGGAMGMLWAFNSLYVNGRGPDGQAIYRLRDADGDGNLEQWTLFKKIPGGGGEHGTHALVLGPDNKIYVSNGNSTPLVEGIAPDSPFRNYAEDSLLPRIKDPVATFFDNLKSPYGHILRTDENGTKWELVAAGFRNQYDIDFNPAGDLFTYDSDMEWDVGLPWYRPTRVLQILEGGEYGFREGGDKWPDTHADTLPAAVDIGLGSPTGVKFGTRSNFPAPYREALFALDWTFGRILAVHLKKRDGAYGGRAEVFLQGKGLPVTDVEFAKDGAMVFTVGGRGTQAALYRVAWTGAGDTVKPGEPFAEGKPDPARFADFARRLALEKAGDTSDILVAARIGKKEDQDRVLRQALEEETLSPLARLRVINLSLTRHGKPAAPLLDELTRRLAAEYPARTFAENRDLGEILAFLNAPGFVEATLRLLETTPAPAEQIAHARLLCELPTESWTAPQRERYFRWFARALDYKGGNSFAKFIERIGDRALTRVPPAERADLDAFRKPKPFTPPVIVARAFQRAYTLADADALLARPAGPRDLARGREIYTSTQCALCHKFKGEGGNTGPDLTAVAGRFGKRDILEAILDPSKAISEQYVMWEMKWGGDKTVAGMIVEDNNDRFTLLTDPIGGHTEPVPKFLLKSKTPSPVSIMPPGLINVLTEAEILDLLAYLESGLAK